ncbi:response regulator transcription factor [Thiolapillus brandeum]|uniref:Phosphate regulon transcriptional regulatory protein PhoB n=1 Tax=Thiolapillus brandeum TaxID=1076588 RepID=A0A7U6JHN4_9GAMM|nr:response regulator transcription factor [Thiolapillus brandeum]BAO44511.1 two-component system transcriptional regulator [Thiolapillus brandeum]
MTKILVIEDDQDIAFLVAMHLRDHGSEVAICHDGQEGLKKACSGEYELIILDLMLPGIDGLEICRQVRAMEHYTPILMLTARNSEMDRVLGLEIGADDYLSKPFSVRELVARTRAICRRMSALKNHADSPPGVLKINGLEIDYGGRLVRLEDVPLDLTAREFDLLWHFAEHPGQVFSRCQLLDAVWGYSHEGYEHTVNSHINRLRAKIERDPSHPEFILTVWGVGYKFTSPQGARS